MSKDFLHQVGNLSPNQRIIHVFEDGSLLVGMHDKKYGKFVRTFQTFDLYQEWVDNGGKHPLEREGLNPEPPEQEAWLTYSTLLAKRGGYLTRKEWSGNRKIFYISPVEQGFETVKLDGSSAPMAPFYVERGVDGIAQVYTPTEEDRGANDWEHFVKGYVFSS